jgi:hypothetical protein
MALNVTKENGVNKLKVSADVLVYSFYPIAIVTVNTSTTVITTQLNNVGVPPTSTKFADLEDNYGTANAESYADYLANNGFYGADSGGGGGGIAYISTLANLPDPVGGVIDLLDDGILYYFTKMVDCLGLTIRLGNNAFQAISQELAGIENAVIDIDTTCTVSSFRFNNISMTIDDINGAYDWQFVNFYNSNNLNIINAANVVWETFGFINTYNLQITGNVSSFVLSPNCIFRSVTTEVCDFFAVRSTAVVSRRIRIEKSVFITYFATQNPIIVDVGSSIPVESFVMSTVGFIGNGSIVGINGDDDIANFRDCTGDGIVNSTSVANMYIIANATDTIAAQNVKAKYLGTTLVSSVIQRFAHDAANNTLEYLSSVPRIFKIQVPHTTFAGNNNVVNSYIGVTPSGGTENPAVDFIESSISSVTTNGTRPERGFSQAIVTLNQGDKVYFIGENTSNSDFRGEGVNMIVETANV